MHYEEVSGFTIDWLHYNWDKTLIVFRANKEGMEKYFCISILFERTLQCDRVDLEGLIGKRVDYIAFNPYYKSKGDFWYTSSVLSIVTDNSVTIIHRTENFPPEENKPKISCDIKEVTEDEFIELTEECSLELPDIWSAHR